MKKNKSLITIKNCNIENSKTTVIKNFSWTIKEGESWLVIGRNGSGKAEVLKALANKDNLHFVPSLSNDVKDSIYSNLFNNTTEIVSLEIASKIIQEERENDESEYVEGGVDKGRSGRKFLSEVLENDENIEEREEVKLCGLTSFLDRGLKYMSTGEIRRTLLCRALLSKKELLILSDPFAGLDKESRTILFSFFNKLQQEGKPCIILSMERWHEIPDGITHVLEMNDKKVSFIGSRKEYETLLNKRSVEERESKQEEKKEFTAEVEETIKNTKTLSSNTNNYIEEKDTSNNEILVQMTNVNVGWDDKRVLRNLNWTLRKGENWLIRGPNGCGKTTLLELITGDNMQVFSNDIKIFGNKRGSGESIWDIKKKLGIVSYRLHVEYRMLSGTSLENVIISGLRDSIGLYGKATDMEMAQARKWLKLGGFEGREKDNFGSLSYGEQRAILILRGAIKLPEILILDEPCHGLDESYREKILTLMEKIGEGGTTTMLHVTHDPSEVLSCEKHILELNPNEEVMYKVIDL